jgi:hypothetical protein
MQTLVLNKDTRYTTAQEIMASIVLEHHKGNEGTAELWHRP